MKMRRFIYSMQLLAIMNVSAAAAEEAMLSGYKVDTQKLCDGYPQLQIETPEGMCVGLMAHKQDGLKMPRYATQAKDGVTYITEMGGWAYGKGTVYAMYKAKDSAGIEKTFLVNLFPNSKLTMPNGIVVDPEGRIYLGLPTGVFRFSPRDLQTGKFNVDAPLEPVFTDFAKSIFRKDEYGSAGAYNSMESKFKNKHPLVQIAVNKDFTEMYVNVGAPSDDCSRGIKTLDDKGKCIQSESPLASAAVWKVKFSADKSRKQLGAAPFARGLRNSMALAVHPSAGTVIQGENGIDLPDEDLPYEELNILQEGKHYGWPYCHSRAVVAPNFVEKITSEECLKTFTMPKVFMPGHVAPLGLLYYNGSLLPELNGQVLVAWHGYQKYGQRVVGYKVDAKGVPLSNEYQQIMFNWAAKEGIRPRGAPTGLTQLNDGSVLILDDKNSAVLRLSKGKKAFDSDTQENNKEISEDSLAAFTKLTPFLKKNCTMCHTQFQKESAKEMFEAMKGNMLNLSSPQESSFFIKLQTRQMPPDMMKPALQFSDKEYEVIQKDLESFMKSLSK